MQLLRRRRVDNDLYVCDYLGLSSETKPTDLAVNSTFIEYDTYKDYIYTLEGWRIRPYAGVLVKDDGSTINTADILDSVHYIDEISTTTYPYLGLRQGRSYAAGHIFEGVITDAYSVVYFVSGAKECYLTYSIATIGQTYFGVYTGATITDDGTSLHIASRNAIPAISPTAAVYHTPTYSSLGTLELPRMTTENGPAKGGSETGDVMALVVAPYTAGCIAVQNKAATANNINIIVNWVEAI